METANSHSYQALTHLLKNTRHLALKPSNSESFSILELYIQNRGEKNESLTIKEYIVHLPTATGIQVTLSTHARTNEKKSPSFFHFCWDFNLKPHDAHFIHKSQLLVNKCRPISPNFKKRYPRKAIEISSKITVTQSLRFGEMIG